MEFTVRASLPILKTERLTKVIAKLSLRMNCTRTVNWADVTRTSELLLLLWRCGSSEAGACGFRLRCGSVFEPRTHSGTYLLFAHRARFNQSGARTCGPNF